MKPGNNQTVLLTTLFAIAHLYQGGTAFQPSPSRSRLPLSDQSQNTGLPDVAIDTHNSMFAMGTDSVDSAWRNALQVAAGNFRQSSGGRLMFTIGQLEREAPPLAHQVKQKVDFRVPKTHADAARVFLSNPSIQMALSFLTLLSAYRLSLGSIGASDLMTVVATAAFWNIQEWAFHVFAFHGEEDGKAVPLFKHHDLHHDLPFFHVAFEPFELCAWWLSAMVLLSGVAIGCGASAAIVADFTATYIVGGLSYLAFHYLAHTKVPLKGWLQAMREHHMRHHISHDTNMNIGGPHGCDSLFGTATALKQKRP